MQESYDYKKFAILYVDDEEKSLKSFARAFNDTFWILTAANAKDGLSLLETHKDQVGLLMTDQRMPGEKGVWLLERARQVQPHLIRVLATAYSDMEAAIAAVNTGAIYKFVTKPWDPVQLEQTLKRGLEFFLVQRERDQLLKEKMSILQNMMVADRIISLGLLAAGLGHHIRNALVAVKTFLDLAPTKMQEEKLEATRLRNPEFWKEYYQNVQGQIQKINNLLNALGAASEKPSFQFPDQVRLHEVIAGVLARLKESFASRSIQVENQVPDSLPVLTVDGSRFARLFELLLRDEIVSLPAGSSITLAAKTEPGGQDQDEVEIEIQDNGPGLPEEVLRLLFDPFAVRSDNPAEYGINLMACYFIVHHHGGKIEARSEPGRGTHFRIRIPVNPSQVAPLTESAEFLQKALLNEQLWAKLSAS